MLRYLRNLLLANDVNIIRPIVDEDQLYPTVDDATGIKCFEVKAASASGVPMAFFAKFFPGKIDQDSIPAVSPPNAKELLEGASTGVFEAYVPVCLTAINAMHTLVVWPDKGDPAVRYIHITDAIYYAAIDVTSPVNPQNVKADGTIDVILSVPGINGISVKVYPGMIDAGTLPWLPDDDAVALTNTAGTTYAGTVDVGEVLVTSPLKKTLAMWPLGAAGAALSPQILHFQAKLPAPNPITPLIVTLTPPVVGAVAAVTARNSVWFTWAPNGFDGPRRELAAHRPVKLVVPSDARKVTITTNDTVWRFHADPNGTSDADGLANNVTTHADYKPADNRFGSAHIVRGALPQGKLIGLWAFRPDRDATPFGIGKSYVSQDVPDGNQPGCRPTCLFLGCQDYDNWFENSDAGTSVTVTVVWST